MLGKILIVDDHEDTLRLIGFILEQNGYTVCSGSSGREALFLAEEQRPDLILLDIMMPEMDGYEVCRILRAKPDFAQTPIIMFTAKDQAQDKWEGFEAGADDFLVKPTDPAELIQRIQTLLLRSDERVESLELSGEGPSRARSAPVSAFDDASTHARVVVKGESLIAVIGARGGAGATTTAINLAYSLVEAGQPTTLVDLDTIQGHVAMYLDQNPRVSVNDLAHDGSRPLTRGWRSYTVEVENGPELLLARSNLDGKLPVPSADQIARLMNALVQAGRFVVVDVGRGLLPTSMPVLKRAGQIILCTQPERVSIFSARAFASSLSRQISEDSILRVVMLSVGRELTIPPEAVKEFLRHSLLASVSVERREMDEAVNQNTPLVRMWPDSAAAVAFRKAAAAVQAHARAPAEAG